MKILRESDFRNFVELRQTFPSADLVGGQVVFDVGGNKVRAITVIEFGEMLVIIQAVLTHQEYDRGKWKG